MVLKSIRGSCSYDVNDAVLWYDEGLLAMFVLDMMYDSDGKSCKAQDCATDRSASTRINLSCTLCDNGHDRR